MRVHKVLQYGFGFLKTVPNRLITASHNFLSKNALIT